TARARREARSRGGEAPAGRPRARVRPARARAGRPRNRRRTISGNWRISGPPRVVLHRSPVAAVRKLLLLMSLCALAAAFAPGRAWASDPCGRPGGHANWIDFGSPDFADLFGRRGTILAVSSGDFPAKMRAAGAITVYWDMYLSRRVGHPSAPADPVTIVPAANRLFDYADTQSSCSNPWLAENELFGAGLATPWSDTNTQYRANVLTYLQTLAARGARPFLLVSSQPFTGAEAAAWWQQVAAVADIVRETYFSAKNLYQQGPIVGNRTVRTVMRSDL